MSGNEWRITTGAIELEMERIEGLLQKSIQFQSRTSAPHPLHERHESRHETKLPGELAHRR